MRITSGKFKGKKLVENTFEHIRPTADMVKQSIFNKLQAQVLGAKVLDLFCGTGSLGIEALSRGASMVVMADLDKRSVALTQNNLKLIGSPKEARVVQGDYKDILAKLKGQKFDIILLDPPYKAGLYEDCVKNIYDKGLLAENGVIVCEHNKEDDFDFSVFACLDKRTYGIKAVTYLLNK